MRKAAAGDKNLGVIGMYIVRKALHEIEEPQRRCVKIEKGKGPRTEPRKPLTLRRMEPAKAMVKEQLVKQEENQKQSVVP